MAVIPMKKMTLFALKRDRKTLLEFLQRRGAVEVTDVPLNDELFSKTDSSRQFAHFDRCQNTVRQALELLDHYAPEKKSMFSSLQGKPELSPAEYDELVRTHEEAIAAARRIVALSRSIAEAKAEQTRLENQLAALNPWLSLDLSMRFRGTRQTAAFIGTVPDALSLETLLGFLAQEAPDAAVHAEILSSTPDQTCIFVLCMKSQSGAVESALRAHGFSQPASPTKLSPAETAAEYRRHIQELDAQIGQKEEEIVSFAPMRPRIEFLADYYAMRREKYQVIDKLSQTKNVFVLQGYLPAPTQQQVEKDLAPFCAAAEFSDPDEKEQPPVLLQNNRFSEPVEGVIEMYSMPGKRDIDPTSVMAVFYYILFGMMLSDAAYGILMAIGCFFVVKKFPKMSASLQKTLRMFFWCGVSTAIWGALLGGWFGDAPAVIAKTFFHSDFSIPALWLVPLEDPMTLLMISFVIGIIHLFTGLGIQFYQLWKRGDKAGAIYDVGFWYGLLIGLIVWLMSTDMLRSMANLSFTVPPAVVTAAKILAGLSAIGIIATAGRESRAPFKRLLKGLYGLYGVTNYLSDVLSYARLLALGLATGVIASVINQMGAMGGDSVFGAIVFILVFIIGHIFNLAINLLGAYVHTNRLQYVEFFGKFYEGGGEKYTPFAANTKFYTIKEEN
ncbi:MAG: V-type ATP synthase subunit I [Firmicutes bacterium]|nr:V-type ATP synthase subunit I [Bacillota bacterium]